MGWFTRSLGNIESVKRKNMSDAPTRGNLPKYPMEFSFFEAKFLEDSCMVQYVQSVNHCCPPSHMGFIGMFGTTATEM